MSLAIASILAILGLEYICRVPLAGRVNLLIEVVKKSLAIIRSRKVSDHWKEIVLLRYARDLSKHTLFIALLIIGLVLLIGIPSMLLDRLIQPTLSIVDNYWNLRGLIIITIVCTVYAIARRRYFTN